MTIATLSAGLSTKVFPPAVVVCNDSCPETPLANVSVGLWSASNAVYDVAITCSTANGNTSIEQLR